MNFFSGHGVYSGEVVRSAGIDIASVGYVAFALVVDGEPHSASVWKANERDSDPQKIFQFYRWLFFKLRMIKPDIVAVEELAVFLNKKVIRSLSKREGVALLAAKQQPGVVVVNPPINQARGIIFGKGNISKDQAWEEIKKMYPNFPFAAKNRGGPDQADALVHALAAPTILERRK